ncbi:MAG: DUF4160 domain-containing protein [Gemmatimonadota bacterium]
MPTAMRIGPYRFFFYAGDREEPIHVHVRREAFEAKFWLEPVCLARNHGFGGHELDQILDLVAEHAEILKDAWRDYFEA